MPDPQEGAGGSQGYVESLVFTNTSDGLPLEGAQIAPVGDSRPPTIVWIHGGVSKFYERHYVELGRELALRGYSFLTGNTRGHDGFTLISRREEVVIAGGSFERFDECPHDMAAWVDKAVTQDSRGVILAGHSLGASKVVYYQARRQDPRVLGLILASPPEGWQPNLERVALAEQMVNEGRGEELMPHLGGSPAWNIVSAQMVATREHVCAHALTSETSTPDIGEIRCPILILYGTEEEIDESWLETLRSNAQSASRIDIEQVDGAGHEYAGYGADVADRIVAWADGLGYSS